MVVNFGKQATFLGTWVWRILRGSFYWLLGNFIYVFLVMNFLLAETVDEMGTLVITGVLLIPFIFAPGTIAAFSCVRKFFDETKTASFSVFAKAYKENYRMAMSHGFIFVFATFLLYVAYWYYGSFGIVGKIVPASLMIVALSLFLFVLAYTSDRKERLWDYWKLGGLLLINHPMFTLFMTTEIFFVLYFCHYIGALLLFVAPGAILLIVYYFYTESVKAEAKKMMK